MRRALSRWPGVRIGFLCVPLLLVSARAATIVNDTWADGSRNETSLPGQSAWFTSGSSTNLAASAGSMIGYVSNSRLWMTYFTTDPDAPVTLGVGQTLRATVRFTPENVTTSPSTTRGLRVGLYYYTNSAHVMADGVSTSGGNATNVTGYMLNMNFAQTATISNPIELRERVNMASANLMGASADYAALGTGGGNLGDPLFSSGVSYQLELSITRNPGSVDITAEFSDMNGWSISHTVTDTVDPYFRFDTFAIRPNGAGDSAEVFQFSQFQLEVIPEPSVLALSVVGLLSFGCCYLRRRRR